MKIINIILGLIICISLVNGTIDTGFTMLDDANSNSAVGTLMDGVPPLTACVGSSSGDSSLDYSDRGAIAGMEGDGTFTYMCGTGFDVANTNFNNNRRLVLGHFRITGRAFAESGTVSDESFTFFLLSDGSANESYRGINLGGTDNSFQVDSMEFGSFVWQPKYTQSLTTRFSGQSNFDVTNITRFEFGYSMEQTGRTQNLVYSRIGYVDPYVMYGGTLGTPTDWEELYTYTRNTDIIRVTIGVPDISLSIQTPITIGKSGTPTVFNDLGLSIDYRPNVQDANTDLNRKVHVPDGFEWIDTDLQSGDIVLLSGTYLDSSGEYMMNLNSSVGAQINISGILSNWGNIYFGSDVALTGIIKDSSNVHLDGANLQGGTLDNNNVNSIGNTSDITNLIVKNNDVGLEIEHTGTYELGTLTFDNNNVDINVTCTDPGTVTIKTQGQTGLNILDNTGGSCNFVLDQSVDIVLNLNPANGSIIYQNLNTSAFGQYIPSEQLVPAYPSHIGDSLTISVNPNEIIRVAYSYAGYNMQLNDINAGAEGTTKDINLVLNPNVDMGLIDGVRSYMLNSTVNGTNPVKVFAPEMNLNKGDSKALVSLGQDINNSLVGAIEQGLNNFVIEKNQVKLSNDAVQFLRKTDLTTSQFVVVGIHFNLTNYSIIVNPQDVNNMRVEFPNVPLDAGDLSPENLEPLEDGILQCNINILTVSALVESLKPLIYGLY